MKAWLATQIERIESVPEYDYDDSGQHLYVIGPDDQTDFAYVVREAYIRAAKHGCNAPPPDAMLTKPDALYALRSLLAWLDGQGNPKSVLTPPELAKEWGISSDKVLGWIRSGQLKARNVSNGTRPRYNISRDDLKLFRPPAEKLVKRSRRKPDPSITQYY